MTAFYRIVNLVTTLSTGAKKIIWYSTIVSSLLGGEIEISNSSIKANFKGLPPVVFEQVMEIAKERLRIHGGEEMQRRLQLQFPNNDLAVITAKVSHATQSH